MTSLPVREQPHHPPSLVQALERVLSPDAFPYASNWDLFRDAHFGRDALETSEDLLAFRPSIARATIRRLAELQGTIFHALTEEEPGKIHHEYRALNLDGRAVNDESRRIFRHLARRWHEGASEDELTTIMDMTYYGTIDATPLYVRLVARYCSIYGRAILSESYVPRHGEATDPLRTIRESVRAAVEWIARRVEASDLGLLEFQRMTPEGHRFQAWKDGLHSYLHPDGEPANYDGPIASIEVQGLAYDALTMAPQVLEDAHHDHRERWQLLAQRLRAAVLDRFWMPGDRYFALAIDRDRATGEPRQVKLVTSNPGALLDSTLFDGLLEDLRHSRVSAIVDRLYGPEFLTPVGVRCTSLRHADVPGYPAYQSSYTVWHKETYDIAKGFRRQGFGRLAEDLENRLLNGVNVSGVPQEFMYVMPDGRVDYHPYTEPVPGAIEIVGTNTPERDQAWTIAAALAIKWSRGRPRGAAPAHGGWQADLERRKLREIPPVHLYRTLHEVANAFPTSYRFWINLKAGHQVEDTFTRGHLAPGADGG